MSAKSRELSIGIIGAGRIGMLHAHNLAHRVPHARVVGVADPRLACASAAAAVARAHVVVDDYRQLLAERTIDAVIISSSTDTHARIIGEAAAAGKHIFCEKPIDHDVERIREALQAVAKARVHFQVGFNRRFDPDFQALRQQVGAGLVGVPQLVRITSRDPAPPPAEYIRVSGGLFLDMSIHDLDLARFLVQEPVVEVFATGSAFDPVIAALGDIDTAVILLRFAGGAICSIDNSRRAVYGYDQRLEVFGSRGCLSVPNRTPTHVEHWDGTGQHRDRLLHFFIDRYQESYVAEMQEFVERVRHGRDATVSGRDGLQAVQLALAARTSFQEGRSVHLEPATGLDAA